MIDMLSDSRLGSSSSPEKSKVDLYPLSSSGWRIPLSPQITLTFVKLYVTNDGFLAIQPRIGGLEKAFGEQRKEANSPQIQSTTPLLCYLIQTRYIARIVHVIIYMVTAGTGPSIITYAFPPFFSLLP